MVTWLAEPTVDALRSALRTVASDLAGGTIVARGLTPDDDPQWCSASAVVGDRFVVKFAWAEPPARRILHQVRLLDALRAAAPRLPLPEVVAVSDHPALLVTRRSAAIPFFDVRHRVVRHRVAPAAAHDLAAVLAELHHPGVLTAVTEALGPLPEPVAPATTGTLRARFGALVAPGRRAKVLTWCDWADKVLAGPGRTVLVHGDLHGDNHLWDSETLRLRLVIDLETAGAGEPEFDMRCLPGDCGVELFTATVAEYERFTGTTVNVDRVMAWHVRTVLGDALWRAEAGVPLPGNGTPAQWVDDLDARFAALGQGFVDYPARAALMKSNAAGMHRDQ